MTETSANDKDLHTQISELVDTEHRLRAAAAAGEITSDDEHTLLSDAEAQLDRLWDLLRQRQARREFGQDPSGAQLRSTETVEGYHDDRYLGDEPGQAPS